MLIDKMKYDGSGLGQHQIVIDQGRDTSVRIDLETFLDFWASLLWSTSRSSYLAPSASSTMWGAALALAGK
jgi:hypothetical protein